jgi:hypothetical protein
VEQIKGAKSVGLPLAAWPSYLTALVTMAELLGAQSPRHSISGGHWQAIYGCGINTFFLLTGASGAQKKVISVLFI